MPCCPIEHTWANKYASVRFPRTTDNLSEAGQTQTSPQPPSQRSREARRTPLYRSGTHGPTHQPVSGSSRPPRSQRSRANANVATAAETAIEGSAMSTAIQKWDAWIQCVAGGFTGLPQNPWLYGVMRESYCDGAHNMCVMLTSNITVVFIVAQGHAADNVLLSSFRSLWKPPRRSLHRLFSSIPVCGTSNAAPAASTPWHARRLLG